MASPGQTYEPGLTGLLIVNPYKKFPCDGRQALRTQPLYA